MKDTFLVSLLILVNISEKKSKAKNIDEHFAERIVDLLILPNRHRHGLTDKYETINLK